MTLLVTKEHQGLADLTFVHGPGKGTGGTAKNAVLLIALSQDIFAAGAADDIMTPVAGDSLRAIVPEQNLSVSPDQVHAGLQAVQHGAEDVRILKFRHGRG